MSALIAEDSGISVAFQPIWDLRRGVVLAHEALLRLPADCCIDGPQEAFELAARLGIAADLDTRARRAVLAAVRDRPWQGLLFLNVHPDALAGLDVDEMVRELQLAGLEPGDVVLEVTEQAGLDRPEPIRVLKQARERGFRLALDDMGHSNAGLRALTHGTLRRRQARPARRRQARNGAGLGSDGGCGHDFCAPHGRMGHCRGHRGYGHADGSAAGRLPQHRPAARARWAGLPARPTGRADGRADSPAIGPGRARCASLPVPTCSAGPSGRSCRAGPHGDHVSTGRGAQSGGRPVRASGVTRVAATLCVKQCESPSVALPPSLPQGGRLLFHLFGALAQFEREIRDRTVAGLTAARAGSAAAAQAFGGAGLAGPQGVGRSMS